MYLRHHMAHYIEQVLIDKRWIRHYTSTMTHKGLVEYIGFLTSRLELETHTFPKLDQQRAADIRGAYLDWRAKMSKNKGDK